VASTVTVPMDKNKRIENFAMLMDCTGDTGHVEQMSAILTDVDTDIVNLRATCRIYFCSGSNVSRIDGCHFKRITKSRSRYK
jgi:hypothetical protein